MMRVVRKALVNSPPLEGEVVRVSEPEGLFLRHNTPQPLRDSPPCMGAKKSGASLLS